MRRRQLLDALFAVGLGIALAVLAVHAVAGRLA
jgi:hypothetical protein